MNTTTKPKVERYFICASSTCDHIWQPKRGHTYDPCTECGHGARWEVSGLLAAWNTQERKVARRG